MRFALLLGLCCLAVLPVGVLAKVYIIENRVNTTGGNGSSDGNNYVSGLSVTNDTGKHTLTLSRVGLSDLLVSWDDQTSAPGSGDGNNYTVACSVTGTTTKSATCSRNSWLNYTFSWDDLDTDTNSENASWSEARADTLYYPRTTNPLGFYNATTIPAYFPSAGIGGAVGFNLTYSMVAAAVGNWSLDKPSYAPLAALAGATGQNLTYSMVLAALGNWSAEKASYAPLSVLGGAVGQNLTYSLVASGVGNWSADKSSYTPIASLAGAVGQNLTYLNVQAAVGNFSQNVTKWSACSGTDKSVWNGSGFTCQTDQTGGGTTGLLNITYARGFRDLLYAAGPAGISLSGIQTTARCSTFPVEQGTQLSFDNMKVMVDNTNASIQIFLAIYNCSSSNTFDCTLGNLIINTTGFNLTATAMQGVTNTTGNWTLGPGNYVTCTSAKRNNGQSGILRGTTGSAGTGSTLRTTVAAGNFNQTQAFTASEADGVPFVYFYRTRGVQP